MNCSIDNVKMFKINGLKVFTNLYNTSTNTGYQAKTAP